ncbi:MAG: hypothetical protein ACJZZ9_07435 [Cytophagales bacterium]
MLIGLIFLPSLTMIFQVLFFHFILQKSSEETFSYDVNYHLNINDSWSDMKKIHDDNTFSEHGFVSSVPFKDGFIVSAGLMEETPMEKVTTVMQKAL